MRIRACGTRIHADGLGADVECFLRLLVYAHVGTKGSLFSQPCESSGPWVQGKESSVKTARMRRIDARRRTYGETVMRHAHPDPLPYDPCFMHMSEGLGCSRGRDISTGTKTTCHDQAQGGILRAVAGASESARDELLDGALASVTVPQGEYSKFSPQIACRSRPVDLYKSPVAVDQFTCTHTSRM